MTKIVHAHARVARYLDGAHPRLRAIDHMERDVDELLFGVGRQRMGNHRLMEAILGQQRPHLFEGAAQIFLGETGAGRQLAGALKLCIDRSSLGAVHVDGADEGARRSAKNESHAVLLALALDGNGFKNAGRKKLAQALFQVFPAQRRSLGLRQMPGQRGETVR